MEHIFNCQMYVDMIWFFSEAVILSLRLRTYFLHNWQVPTGEKEKETYGSFSQILFYI